jgi:hypothetical protein
LRSKAVAAAFLLIASTCGAAEQDEDIMFAEKSWADIGEVVGVSGTLTGDGVDEVATRNNTYVINCINKLGYCIISSIEQIGPKRIGRMEFPYLFPIVRWTPSEVVAHNVAPTGCVATTLTLFRSSRTVTWVREGVTQICKEYANYHKEWRIEDPIGYKKPHRQQ